MSAQRYNFLLTVTVDVEDDMSTRRKTEVLVYLKIKNRIFAHIFILQKFLAMKIIRFIILLIISVLILNSISAQAVFSTEYKYDADVKVYVSDYKYEADLVVYKTNYKYEADGNKGVWYFTDYKYDAKKKIYFTDYKYEADLVIYFTTYKYEAGWQKKEKQYLMY